MTTSELSANTKTKLNAALWAVVALAGYVVVRFFSGAGIPSWSAIAVFVLSLIMGLILGIGLLPRYSRGTPFGHSRKFLLYHAWFYMFTMFVFSPAAMMMDIRKDAEVEVSEQANTWEDPNKYHYLIFDQTIDPESIAVSVNNSPCRSEVLDDRKSARYFIDLYGKSYSYGDTCILNIRVVQEGQVRQYSFNGFVLNQPPDSLFVALDGN